MGTTIHYRGSIEDLDRVEDLEDRVVDFALAVGGSARIWRTACVEPSRRFIRGILLHLAPGQETTSLLLSPEGCLIPMTAIEDAERSPFSHPPWCSVKTQFGSIESHVLLVELLSALKQQFLGDLEVQDEGGYWEHRDFDALRRQFELIDTSLDLMADGLKNKYSLTAEAAEDAEIITSRLERIAQLAHRAIFRPSEHPPVSFDDESDDQTRWEALFRENRRKQERLHRAIEERQQQGEDPSDALKNAMRDEGLLGLPDESAFGAEPGEFRESTTNEYNDGYDNDDDEFDDDDGKDGWLTEEDLPSDEPWQESLQEDLAADAGEHPLVLRAMDLMEKCGQIVHHAKKRCSQASVLLQGAGDLMGGLVQGLDTEGPPGLNMVQLKRALRGAAFAWGALFPLKADDIIDQRVFDELGKELQSLESAIRDELAGLYDSD